MAEKSLPNKEQELAEHFFRNEYGKMVAVVARYLGAGQIEAAEDIVQETLLTAVDYWKHKGIPKNPKAWLYTTARNKTFNFLKHQKYKRKFENEVIINKVDHLNFSEEQIADEQLRMMFACCDSSISEEVQITLVLKILCGFSIAEISAAFFTSTDTINKRLVRGRKKLRAANLSPGQERINENCDAILKAIYMIFNEGYMPNRKNQIVRPDLCLEAIRLAELMAAHPETSKKADSHALLALMYLNTSRFKGRLNDENVSIEMEKVDRSLWNNALINKGLYHLDQAQQQDTISSYLLMASISANHCIAPSFEETNWTEILNLYDTWLKLEDKSMIRLNRAVALAKVQGNEQAIVELKQIEMHSDLKKSHLFHSTIGELYRKSDQNQKAAFHFNKAIELSENERDKIFLIKKLGMIVPVSKSQL